LDRKPTKKEQSKLDVNGEEEEIDHFNNEADDLKLPSDESDAALSSEGEQVIDLARGDGMVESSDEELDSEVEMESVLEGPYNNENIPLGDETRRLAVVNMDWDNIRAKDLFKVFEAFKPKQGSVTSVKIYLSDFGRERQESENADGPPVQIFNDTTDDGPLVKEDDGKEFNIQELRKYQLDRLRYYYAIVETNSVETARAIFEACDGSEFESSGIIDLQ
jgi:hypothetical protein